MSFFRSRCRSSFRRALCLVCVLAVLLLAGCKAEIYQGLSENQANTMLSVLLRHGIWKFCGKTASRAKTSRISVRSSPLRA